MYNDGTWQKSVGTTCGALDVTTKMDAVWLLYMYCKSVMWACLEFVPNFWFVLVTGSKWTYPT